MLRFEVVQGRDGRWLIRDGERRFVVAADHGAQFTRPDGERRWRSLTLPTAGNRGRAQGHRGLWLRITLVPEFIVRWLAGKLEWLACWPIMSTLAGLGLVVVVFLPAPGVPGQPVHLITVVAMFLLTALAHELGHAAALSREGWPPGAVGAGVLWILPVFWCDVSAVSILPRAGRVRVDLGGICFQLMAGGCLVVIGWLFCWRSAFLAAHAVILAVIWSLLPILRTDGYWLGCDLLGLEDMESKLPKGASRRRSLALNGWRLMTALVLLAMVLTLPLRLHARIHDWYPDHPTIQTLGGGLVGLIMLVGAWRALGRVVRLLAIIHRDRKVGE